MKNELKNRKIKILLEIVFGLLIGANIFTLYLLKRETAADILPKDCNVDFKLINPRFACGQKALIDKREYNAFRSKVEEFINEEIKTGKADSVGVWFRDLEFGPTFGISQDEDFIPASLLKLPLAITYFEIADYDPGILERTIIYTSAVKSLDQAFVPGNPLELGKIYTVDELIKHMLIYSDNNAYVLLYEFLRASYPDNPLSNTYRNLGILDTDEKIESAEVNAKGYGAIFRLLYNVSYLNKDSSEKLLSLLEQSIFYQGLRKELPTEIKVADKFGERFLENDKKQLHDCGIIYYPGNPYELCVMTRGNNFEDLSYLISKISKMTYEEFDSRNILNKK